VALRFRCGGHGTFRALALLGSHREHYRRAREGDLPLLRAAVLESLRLWPTTPLVLRETRTATEWRNGTMPAGTAIVIFAPFFHRNAERLPFADRLAPEIWRNDRPIGDWPLIPFSEGPARCPGKDLVLLLTTSVLSHLVSIPRLELRQTRKLDSSQTLPASLNHFALRFSVGG